jgi:allantoin racemase
MTANMRRTAERVFQPPWKGLVVQALAGPESLESWRDYYLASVATLPLLRAYSEVDGIVIACFGDPGLFMYKEVTTVPVVGIAEASLSLALLLGGKFGILAGRDKAVYLMESMIMTYGLESRSAGVHALDMPVLSFEKDPELTLTRLEEGGKELQRRGAEVLLLGCAGLTGYTRALEDRLKVTVVDPVEAGCRLLRTIVEMGLKTSRSGLFAHPASQRMQDLEQVFQPDLSAWLKEWGEKRWE